MDLVEQLKTEIANYSALKVEVDKKLAILGDHDAARRKLREAESAQDAVFKRGRIFEDYKNSVQVDLAKRAEILDAEQLELNKLLGRTKESLNAVDSLRSQLEHEIAHAIRGLELREASLGEREHNLVEHDRAVEKNKADVRYTSEKIKELASNL